jgi:subtilisin family serine protease
MKRFQQLARPVRVLLFLAVLALALGLRLDAAPALEGDVKGVFPAPLLDSQSSSTSRMMVIVRPAVTEDILGQLAEYGQIHGWISSLRLVAMTPSGFNRFNLRSLSFVESVEADRQRYLTDVGTWDRDILDVVDVEESGAIADPDPREVSQTGAGVHVAVIDSGLIENWRDFLIESRVDTSLAQSIMGGGAVADNPVPSNEFNTSNPTDHWEKDTNSHGTAVASHIIGFKIRGLVVDGTAPGVTLFPIKVFPNGAAFTWSSRIIAAFEYVTQLKASGRIGPTVISMSVSGGTPNAIERAAIDRAIAQGIVVVTSAGNRGERGMGWPAAFPEVISVGAVGWAKQFQPGTPSSPNFAFWWTQDVGFDPDPRHGSAEESEVFVAAFSSRAIPSRGQQLDVLGPGQWTVAPGDHGPNAAFFFWAGTSFSTPLTAGVAALMLEKDPSLNQAMVESILRSTALPLSSNDSRSGVLSGFDGTIGTISWDTDCAGLACDPVGAGLVQADDALAAIR